MSMKASLYNTFLKITTGSTVIYNALEDKTIVCKGNVNAENLMTQNESLLSKMKEEGFIVPENKDEYACYVEEARKVENDETSFHLLINPTLNCNFKCWYCYESHIPSQMSEDIIERVKRFIDRMYAEGRNLTISFFGGEPMLYYNEVMLPIIRYGYSEAQRTSCGFNANMTSNGYLLNAERVAELSQYGFTGGQITLDGDWETHNSVRFHKPGADTFSRIVDNIRLMAKAGMTTTLRINCTHENLESVSRIPEAFRDFSEDEKRLIRTDLHIVWQEDGRNDLYQNLDSAVETFNANGLPAAKMEFRGFCYGDKRNSCLINFNGDLYKCSAVDFNKTERDGYLTEDGNLVWENDSLEKRMASKFTNKPCKTCRIMPLCHGGCTKQSMTSQNYCIHNQSEEEKDSVVMNRILFNSLHNTPQPF